MAQARKWLVGTSITLMIIIAIVTGLMLTIQAIYVPQADLYIPIYSSISCGVIGDTVEQSTNVYVPAKTFVERKALTYQKPFFCGRNNFVGTFKQCEYTLEPPAKQPFPSLGYYKKCSVNSDCTITPNDPLATRFDSQTRVTVRPNEVLNVAAWGSALTTGISLSVSWKAIAYGIYVDEPTHHRHLVTNIDQGCDQSYLVKYSKDNGYLIDANSKPLSIADDPDKYIYTFFAYAPFGEGSIRDIINNVYLRSYQTGIIQECHVTSAKITSGQTIKSVDLSTCTISNRYNCLPSRPPDGYDCLDGIKVIKTEEGGPCSSPNEKHMTEESGGKRYNCRWLCSTNIKGEDVWVKKECVEIKIPDVCDKYHLDLCCGNGKQESGETCNNCRIDMPPGSCDGGRPDCPEGTEWVTEETTKCEPGSILCQIGLTEKTTYKKGQCMSTKTGGIDTLFIIVAIAIVALMFVMFMMMTMQRRRQQGGEY